MKRILIAGIGNIFNGDDAFGCEVLRALQSKPFPPNVTAIDYGIRGYDLAYALAGDYDAIILIDAISRGAEPGTLFLIEPDVSGEAEPPVMDAHSMNPVAVIRLARSLGRITGKLYLIGCEAAVLDGETGEFGLSARVEAAIPPAMEMAASLVEKILGERKLCERPTLCLS
ncbi:MAG TPA: hydrogenase maturation protease [Verrucomicrobiae bacterium]|jgi:hydrogenase maturation protease